MKEIFMKDRQIVNMMKRAEYQLDGKILETMYMYFAGPILEFFACDQRHKDMIEFVQTEAARIVTEAVKGTKNNLLYNEVG